MASLTKTYTTKKESGRVYTPTPLVDRILDLVGFTTESLKAKKLLDPACGDGQFLVTAAKRITSCTPAADLPIALSHLYGWDTDDTAIAACRQRLDEVVAPFGIHAMPWNIEVRNSLHAFVSDPLFQVSEQFDFIVGNPPYVRIQHLSEQDRHLVRSRFSFCATGSTDLYIAFFELAFSLLATTGVIGFITPNTFFHTTTAQALRHFMSGHQKLRHVINFGHRQVFPDATTYAAITIASAQPNATFVYEEATTLTPICTQLPSAALAGQDVWRFGTLGQQEVLTDRTRFRPLREIASIHVGLATLADPVFIVQAAGTADAAGNILVKTKAGVLVNIEQALLRPIIKGSKVKVGQPCFTGAFVVFPYQRTGQKMALLFEEEIATRFPLGYKYLRMMKPELDKRDNGRPNPAGWYAFGRSQALDSGFGAKIICPPMAPEPTFVVCHQADATVYSSYFIKYSGNLEALAAQLNSERMSVYVASGARDLLGGWKGYTKKSIQDFLVDTTAL